LADFYILLCEIDFRTFAEKKLKNFVLVFSLLLLLIACNNNHTIESGSTSVVTYVNSFIGTGGHGHTYPGATYPFGMMQLSPDTRLTGWDGCSGYHYSDEYIYGFSHTHLSGTGVSDYGDILLMPTHEVIFNNGADDKKGYKAHFSHADEKAEPGYYAVKLDSTNIEVELTTLQRSGIHKYTYKEGDEQVVILDLAHRDEVLDSQISLESTTEITGYRHSKAWAENQQLFFAFTFSRPFASVEFLGGKEAGNNVKAAFIFNNKESTELEVKIAISPVDVEGARNNLEKEIVNKSFDEVKNQVQEEWEKELGKIEVTTDDDDQKTIFYTSLYHTMIAPNLYQDVDGRYRGMDQQVHHTKEFEYYTVFSLWDTYRAAHPLYTIIDEKRSTDFLNTFLAKYEEGGILPIWDLSACYTGCMIGYHSIPVIADAYMKGIKGFDEHLALEAMTHSAEQDHLGLEEYKKFGFIPMEFESESVSKTLEYAYDDWCIAQMAKAMGNMSIYEEYIKRAQNYKNVFDPETQFMRARYRNTWYAPFDPYEVNFNYTEANAWQYTNYVPQDVSGYVQLLGGKQKLEDNLDAVFTAKQETSGRDQADMTGKIGQYVHGNEPSHHMAYLYNYVNQPSKTQKYVNKILNELYTNEPSGIAGNEDCGQMSAWYVLSALGFYPVTPASNEYVIGSPQFQHAIISLENGKKFTIKTDRQSDKQCYITNAFLNGESLERSFITHEEIMNGGVLEFNMSSSPSMWATGHENIPKSQITERQLVPMPFIKRGELAFDEQTDVELGSIDADANIFFRLNRDEFQPYSLPFTIKDDATLHIYAEKDGNQSATFTSAFYKIDPDINIKLNSQYAPEYSAGGDQALIDAVYGAPDFHTGTWQGYPNVDVDVVISFKDPRKLSSLTTQFLQDQRSWIFLPTKVELYGSIDGDEYEILETKSIDALKQSEDVIIEKVTFKAVNNEYSHYKLIAKTVGDLPKWHIGYDYEGKAWVFIDEIAFEE